MIEQLIARVFHIRNVAQWAHWRAKGEGSFATHDALGIFYEELNDAIDPLVEVYQGAYDLIGAIPTPETKGSNILALLKNDAEWIEKNHEKICKGNRAIANLIDTLTAVYFRATYKLRNLK